MRQYLDLLKTIKEKGTHKESARANMPGTTSLFGHQMRFDLSEGFPILTTKKLSFKNIVTELLWFLRGDTNIKYLIDNGCNIWNEDAYNYYLKMLRKSESDRGPAMVLDPYSFEEFIEMVKKGQNDSRIETFGGFEDYEMGSCGEQYGKLWRDWNSNSYEGEVSIDQIKDLIEGLKKNPTGRRHILTAWNPATLDDMALNACHALAQFNCRPLSNLERVVYSKGELDVDSTQNDFDNSTVPKYKLDCQMYQRSADVFLGVPYNISSYALLTEILAKICNMIPGDFIHTFGDVHIYDDHMDQVNEQLTRTPDVLPKLVIRPNDLHKVDFLENIKLAGLHNFELENYNPQPSIKAKLSTGLK